MSSVVLDPTERGSAQLARRVDPVLRNKQVRVLNFLSCHYF